MPVTPSRTDKNVFESMKTPTIEDTEQVQQCNDKSNKENPIEIDDDEPELRRCYDGSFLWVPLSVMTDITMKHEWDEVYSKTYEENFKNAFSSGVINDYDQRFGPWFTNEPKTNGLIENDRAGFPFSDFVMTGHKRRILDNPKWSPNRELQHEDPGKNKDNIIFLVKALEFIRLEAFKDEDEYFVYALHDGIYFPIREEDYFFKDGEKFEYNAYGMYRVLRRNEMIESYELSTASTLSSVYVSHYESLNQKQREIVETLQKDDREFQKKRNRMAVLRRQVSYFCNWPSILRQMKNQQCLRSCLKVVKYSTPEIERRMEAMYARLKIQPTQGYEGPSHETDSLPISLVLPPDQGVLNSENIGLTLLSYAARRKDPIKAGAKDSSTETSGLNATSNGICEDAIMNLGKNDLEDDKAEESSMFGADDKSFQFSPSNDSKPTFRGKADSKSPSIPNHILTRDESNDEQTKVDLKARLDEFDNNVDDESEKDNRNIGRKSEHIDHEDDNKRSDEKSSELGRQDDKNYIEEKDDDIEDFDSEDGKRKKETNYSMVLSPSVIRKSPRTKGNMQQNSIDVQDADLIPKSYPKRKRRRSP